MGFNEVYTRGQLLVLKNSTTILTAVGVTGTVTTAVLTGRASVNAHMRIEFAEMQDISAGPLGRREIFTLTWPLYIPAIGVGASTIAAIIFANRIGSKRAAALAAAYGISERAFTEYKEKVVERLGEGKEIRLRDEIAQDRVNKNPVGGQEVIIVGNGDVLCLDSLSGRYFQSTIESIKAAANKVNFEIINHMYASLSTFYDEIGLPPTSHSDEVGWNSENILDVTYSATISADKRPCIVIDFRVAPITGYGKLY